jgi:hypothetical protein
VVLLSSRPGLDPAAAPCSTCAGFTRSQHPFFRRYGVNLPSSLTRDHSSTLVYSTSLPVSVCGTGVVHLPSRPFVTAQVPRPWPWIAPWPRHCLSVNDGGDLPPPSPYRLTRRSSRRGDSPSAFGIGQTMQDGIGISTDCPSAAPHGYALGPTHPPRCARAAEPLGLRWWGF